MMYFALEITESVITSNASNQSAVLLCPHLQTENCDSGLLGYRNLIKQ